MGNRSFNHVPLLPLLLVFLFFSEKSSAASMEGASSSTLGRVQEYLKRVNKPAVLSIESPDGDIIDCVDKRVHLGFDPSELVEPEIPVWWKSEERKKKKEKHGAVEGGSSRSVWQVWHLNGTRCPKGSVPIRRTKVEDVLRAKSLDHYGRKDRRQALARRMAISPPDAGAPSQHQYAVVSAQFGEKVFGGHGSLNLWNPNVERDDEFSLTQMWVVAGPASDLNTIEAGWQVYPGQYGDHQTRFFVYWTADGYRRQGCYNLECEGFKQVNEDVTLGGAYQLISQIDGLQQETVIRIWKDPKAGDWWLGFGHGEDGPGMEITKVGYWPAKLFPHMDEYAENVDWGGEVVNTGINWVHTKTAMGSGRLAEEGWGKASFCRRLSYVDASNRLKPAPKQMITKDELPKCYNLHLIRSEDDDEFGVHFYYGGPGLSPSCP